jgi:hypothetical protein
MWGYLQVKCVFGGAGAILCVPRLNGGACLAQELTSTLDRNYQPLPQFDDFSTKSPHGAPFSPNSPMAEEERPLSRKPRHRQSRGRGLRKTTGWYVSLAF